MKINKKKLTPMMKQYFEIKEKHIDEILFYRLGDFYEMFFDDAIVASRELEITLTGRNCGLDEKAPLCGVPYHSASRYIEKLVSKGYKVAICEQVEDPALAKGIVKREVVRTITPGMIIEPDMLKEDTNNYISSVYFSSDGYGLSYADITTGELCVTEFLGEGAFSKLVDELYKISPSEIIYDSSISDEFISRIDKNYVKTPIDKSYFEYENGENTITRFFKVFTTDSLGFNGSKALIVAVASLIKYIEDTQKVNLKHFTKVNIYSHSEYMFLDKFTRRNLELTETMRDAKKKGSLLWVLDKTKTSMGKRELKNLLESPLLSVNKIKRRLDSVEILLEDLFLREELKSLLNRIYDLERLSSKLVYGNVNARDLLALKNSLEVIPMIKNLLSDFKDSELESINLSIDLLDDIFKLINDSILEEVPVTIKEGNIIKSTYNDEIYELREAIENGSKWILEIEKRERTRTGIKTLKIGFNKVFGYYIDVTRANSNLVPEDYIRKQTLANSERYITPELKEIESKILGAKEKIVDLEYKIFLDVKNELLNNVSRLLSTAKAIAYLDVLLSFSEVSYQNSYVKPKIDSEKRINIVSGRHPVIEKIDMEESFIPNDTILDNKDNNIYIITGPNMAGKSTYLRQVALITLMAQIGCFVPADYAEIGIVDRIFTRVGASDDLGKGQSTFMVEMSELANILNNATKDSLIILDEIGRGTSTYDGLSIAWAVVEYLSNMNENSPKTMFATHYHELTEIEGKFRGVKNYRISVNELNDEIVFLRKIVEGSANQSYGIQVAKLAGLPDDVINIAKKILKRLEQNDINKNINNILENKELTKDERQISFISEKVDDKLVKRLKNININEITPLESMNILFELIKISKER